jgi:hypothetical protein
VDFHEQIFRFLPGSKLGKKVADEKVNHTPKTSQLDPKACVNVGSRVEVWWGIDARYYEAVVTGIRDSRKPHFLEYFDGECEWVDLKQEKYRILQHDQESTGAPLQEVLQDTTIAVGSEQSGTNDGNSHGGKLAELQIGSRVAVWWEDDARYHAATVKKIEDRKQKKHFHLEYDDDEYEILDLWQEKFQFLQQPDKQAMGPSIAAGVSSGSNIVRALESGRAQKDPKPECALLHNNRKNCGNDTEDLLAVGKSDRGEENLGTQVDYRHLKHRGNDKSSDGAKSSGNECSREERKHRARPPLKKRRIIEDESESNKSTDQILLVGVPDATRAVEKSCLKSKGGTAVEHNCLQTKNAVAVSPSLRQGSENTGINLVVTERVHQHNGIAVADGSFHSPLESLEKLSYAQPIEQVCLKTAKVLKTYDSKTAAAKALGAGKSKMKTVCDGSLPQTWKEMRNAVLIRRFKGGPVIREFESPLRVAALLGVDCIRVCKWCRYNMKTYGLYWSFKPRPMTS